MYLAPLLTSTPPVDSGKNCPKEPVSAPCCHYRGAHSWSYICTAPPIVVVRDARGRGLRWWGNHVAVTTVVIMRRQWSTSLSAAAVIVVEGSGRRSASSSLPSSSSARAARGRSGGNATRLRHRHCRGPSGLHWWGCSLLPSLPSSSSRACAARHHGPRCRGCRG